MTLSKEQILSTTDITVTSPADDKLTLIAIALLVCFLQNVIHEGLGHGVTAWLSGAHRLTLTTVALQSDVNTRWISASGTLINLLLGGIFWLLLLNPRRYRPATRYFLVMAMAGNLFTGTGYFCYSGISNLGDWSAVVHGLGTQWKWRVGLIAIGLVTCSISMRIVAQQLKPFRGNEPVSQRIRVLCWLPYFTEGILAGMGGLLNPAGFIYVLSAAVPSTLGSNCGFLSMPGMMRQWRADEEVGPITRSYFWITAGVIGSLLFVFVLGRGITWSR